MKPFISATLQILLAAALAFNTVLAQEAAAPQAAAPDLVDKALISIFQRDKGHLVCLNRSVSLEELRLLLAPFLKNIDMTKDDAYQAIGVATYTAFPCPFSPNRPELRIATKSDLLGNWLFPDASLKLRHGPKSPAWREDPGAPPIKCEGVAFQESGQYRVVQVRGQSACPTLSDMLVFQKAPGVQSWAVLLNGRLKIARSDVPAQFEEWDVYAVQSSFEFFSVKFAVGDLIAYLRRSPGNEINAASVFRHLQLLR